MNTHILKDKIFSSIELIDDKTIVFLADQVEIIIKPRYNSRAKKEVFISIEGDLANLIDTSIISVDHRGALHNKIDGRPAPSFICELLVLTTEKGNVKIRWADYTTTSPNISIHVTKGIYVYTDGNKFLDFIKQFGIINYICLNFRRQALQILNNDDITLFTDSNILVNSPRLGKLYKFNFVNDTYRIADYIMTLKTLTYKDPISTEVLTNLVNKYSMQNNHNIKFDCVYTQSTYDTLKKLNLLDLLSPDFKIVEGMHCGLYKNKNVITILDNYENEISTKLSSANLILALKPAQSKIKLVTREFMVKSTL